VTFVEYSVGDCSQIHGIAAAVFVIMSSIWPHSLYRVSGFSSSSALDISLLMAGSLRSGQLLLFVVRMFFPLNVGSSSVCGSWKSASQPTFGQMFGSFFGTLQNFVYIAAW